MPKKALRNTDEGNEKTVAINDLNMPKNALRKTGEGNEKTAVVARNLHKDSAEELRKSLARSAPYLQVNFPSCLIRFSLYLNLKYSDLRILCGSEIFPAHRCIVCPRSGFFAGACDSEFQVQPPTLYQSLN